MSLLSKQVAPFKGSAGINAIVSAGLAAVQSADLSLNLFGSDGVWQLPWFSGEGRQLSCHDFPVKARSSSRLK